MSGFVASIESSIFEQALDNFLIRLMPDGRFHAFGGPITCYKDYVNPKTSHLLSDTDSGREKIDLFKHLSKIDMTKATEGWVFCIGDENLIFYRNYITELFPNL